MIPVCGKLEAELAELPAADRQEMLESLGLKEPALALVTRAAYKILGLQSYFTAGKEEIRAWTVHVGDTGPQAAGVIRVRRIQRPPSSAFRSRHASRSSMVAAPTTNLIMCKAMPLA